MATRRGCASVPGCVMRRPFAVVLGAIVGDLNLRRRPPPLVPAARGVPHVANRDYAHQAAPDDNRQMPDAHLRHGVRHRLQIVFRRAHDHVLGHQFTHRVAQEMLVPDGPPHDAPFRDDADRPIVLVHNDQRADVVRCQLRERLPDRLLGADGEHVATLPGQHVGDIHGLSLPSRCSSRPKMIISLPRRLVIRLPALHLRVYPDAQRATMSSETNLPTRQRRVNSNFITEIIDEDLRQRRYAKIVTRFPPEPNGYLHIGHAKSICLNFGLALDYGGECNLRFDDTNPETESIEYVDAAKRDVQWLGFQWARELYASDYFERLYEFAVQLITDGKAYVDSLSDEEISEYRGTVTQPGKPSPYRDRSVEENLELFRHMRDGGFPDGAHALRATIDLASPNPPPGAGGGGAPRRPPPPGGTGPPGGAAT